jgi:hypothetical protein
MSYFAMTQVAPLGAAPHLKAIARFYTKGFHPMVLSTHAFLAVMAATAPAALPQMSFRAGKNLPRADLKSWCKYTGQEPRPAV